jgi:hypothetical protein
MISLDLFSLEQNRIIRNRNTAFTGNTVTEINPTCAMLPVPKGDELHFFDQIFIPPQ